MPMSEKQKKWAVVALVLIGIAIVVVVFLMVFKVIKFGPHGGDSGGKSCGKMFEQCKSNADCCDLPCTDAGTDKICLNPTHAPTMAAFQMQLPSNDYLKYDVNSHKFSTTKEIDWSSWWSWDGTLVRYLITDGDNVTNYCIPSVITSGQSLLLAQQCGKDINKIALTLMSDDKEDLGHIVSTDYRYAIVYDDTKGLIWEKAIDVHSGEGTVFKFVEGDAADCTAFGDHCGGTGELACCPPFENCVDGRCATCIGPPKKCKDSEHVICGANAQWICASNCDPTKKDGAQSKCQSNESVACIKGDDGKWNWGCVTKCQGKEFPSECPQAVCEQDEDGKDWNYKCVNICENKGVHTDPPNPDEVAELKGCTLQKDSSECIGDQDNKKCFKCDDGTFKILYYDCDHDNWGVDYACGKSAKPSDDAVCTNMIPGFCDGKQGKLWVEPDNPGTWCAMGSYYDLTQHKACIVGDSACNTEIYFHGETPVYPTISYNECSNVGSNTKMMDRSTSLNPMGFVDVEPVTGGNKYTFYPSTQSFKYGDHNVDYNPDYFYYKPSQTSSGLNPPFCLLKNPCENGGAFSVTNPLDGHPNISLDDNRAPQHDNAPPTAEEIRGKSTPAMGNCACKSGYVGYTCSVHGDTNCHHPGGQGVTSKTNAPYPGVACQCNAHYAGENCQYSRSDTCRTHGDPKDDGTCTCDSGYAGSTCQYGRSTTCNQHGTPKDDGTCTCDSGYGPGVPPYCQWNIQDQCGSHGSGVTAVGTCICKPGWGVLAGQKCDQPEFASFKFDGTNTWRIECQSLGEYYWYADGTSGKIGKTGNRGYDNNVWRIVPNGNDDTYNIVNVHYNKSLQWNKSNWGLTVDGAVPSKDDRASWKIVWNTDHTRIGFRAASDSHKDIFTPNPATDCTEACWDPSWVGTSLSGCPLGGGSGGFCSDTYNQFELQYIGPVS